MNHQKVSKRYTAPSQTAARQVARGLGLFSIGLGLTELVATKALARFLGMRGKETLIRSYGARELVSGLGILLAGDPTPWVWSRVVGDALDLGTLAFECEDEDEGDRDHLFKAIAAVAGVTALDLYSAIELVAENRPANTGPHNYRNRVGLAMSPNQMRGAASDFKVPDDMRPPKAMRPRQSAGA